jgi:hypothetical protein
MSKSFLCSDAWRGTRLGPRLRPGLHACLVAACLVAACLLAVPAAQAKPVSAAEAAAWRQDLATMRIQMEARHKDLFHHVTAPAFDAEVAALDARIPRLSRDEIVVGLMRLVASVGDGHTAIAPTRDKAIGFHRLPIALYDFEDGLFVRTADRAHADLVGARVLRIGNASAADAMRAAGGIVAQDNAMDVRFLAPMLLAMPEVVHGLGWRRAGRRRRCRWSRAGASARSRCRLSSRCRSCPPIPTPAGCRSRDGWTCAMPSASKRRPGCATLGAFPPRTLAGPARGVRADQPGQRRRGRNLRRLQRAAAGDGGGASRDRLVLDLRLNRGGNGTLLKPLEVGLLKSPADRPGGLVVLMGRSTWSAAQFLLNFLETYTQAAFVGEPSGSRGNIYGDSRKTTLPNSGITVRTSVYYWQDWMPWIPAAGRPRH